MDNNEKGTWILDARNGELYWDEVTKKIHEVDSTYLTSLDQAIQFYREDQRQHVQRDIEELLNSGKAWDSVYCLVTAKGNCIWVRSHGFAVEFEQGRVIKIAGLLYDCGKEQLKLNQNEKLADFLKMTAAISYSDREGRMTAVNWNLILMSGYKENELIGKDHHIFNSGHHSKEFFSELWSTILDGRIWHGEVLNKTKDGNLIWYDTHIQPLTDKDGNVIEFITIRFDITEKKMREERDRQMYSLLTIGENAVSILHEVMNPLSIISAKIEWIKRDAQKSENERAQHHIQDIETNMKRISQIFQDMRGMLHGQGQFGEHCIKEVFEKVKGFSLMKLMKNNVQFTINGDTELLYFGNPGYVTQIILNLINNAIDAVSSLDEKWITINIISVSESEMMISVTDSGTGIDEKNRRRIFEPLFSTKKNTGGTGLGLSLAKQLATAMSGELCYNSTSANTRFHLVLKSKEEGTKINIAV